MDITYNKQSVYIQPCENTKLAVRIPYNRELLNAMRSIQHRKWDAEKKTWFIADRKEYLDLLLESAITLNYRVYIGSDNIFCNIDTDQHSITLSNLVKELTVRKYSRNTIKSYIRYNTELLAHSGKQPDIITQYEITSYQIFFPLRVRSHQILR